MQFKIIHHGRKWPRPDNHLDGRVCPECAATVHGNHAQHVHQAWHVDLAGLLNDQSERIGMEDQPSPEWTAAVDEISEEEAASDGLPAQFRSGDARHGQDREAQMTTGTGMQWRIDDRKAWLAHLRECCQCPTSPCDQGLELAAAVRESMAPGETWEGIWAGRS